MYVIEVEVAMLVAEVNRELVVGEMKLMHFDSSVTSSGYSKKNHLYCESSRSGRSNKKNLPRATLTRPKKPHTKPPTNMMVVTADLAPNHLQT